VLLNRVNLLSRQDTLLTNTGSVFITDSYIEGNTDFMWGTAAAYFQRCELKALDTGTATQGFLHAGPQRGDQLRQRLCGLHPDGG